MEKNSLGKNFNGKNFLWKKIPKLKKSWTNIQLDKISFGKIYIGQKFLRNYFFGKNYLGKISFGNKPLDIFTVCLSLWLASEALRKDSGVTSMEASTEASGRTSGGPPKSFREF